MHQMSAVGIAEEASVDDKGLYVGARIVDPRAWDKVTTGVYKGFSVGGRVKSRDPADRNVITGLSLTEISLVDRPANPEAVFDCWKAAGDHEMADEQMGGDMDYADPGYQADGRKRYPLDSASHIRATWAFIHMASHAEPYTAGELDQIRSRIVAAWKAKIDPAGPPGMSAKASTADTDQSALDHIHDCLKELTAGACCKAAERRPSKTMLGHLKEAHDAICRAGARCDSFVPDEDDAETDTDKSARAGDLMKAFAGEILPRLDALAKRVEEIAAVPLPPLTVARSAGTSISKRDDAGYAAVTPNDVAAALARMSDEERTLALIKAAHANPIRPFSGR
jgi:hypothetical protein